MKKLLHTSFLLILCSTGLICNFLTATKPLGSSLHHEESQETESLSIYSTTVQNQTIHELVVKYDDGERLKKVRIGPLQKKNLFCAAYGYDPFVEFTIYGYQSPHADNPEQYICTLSCMTKDSVFPIYPEHLEPERYLDVYDMNDQDR